MLTVYGRENSSNVRKVLWLLAELGIDDYERLDYGRGYTPCASPEYVALNPNKVVPTLKDGELVLWESNAQMRYLATRHGRDDLYPDELVARTKVDVWLDWQLTTILTGIRVLFQGLHVKDPAFTDPAGIKKAHAQATDAFGILDAHLNKGSDYIAADHLTIADCANGMYVHRWFALPIERAEYPALAAYYERLKQRKPFQDKITGIGV